MRNRIPQSNVPSHGCDRAVKDDPSRHRDRRRSHARQIERDLAPLRSFIDDQMIDNVLGVLQIELARVNAGREPRNREVAEFLLDVEPSDLLRLIRTHPMMRGLESLTASDSRMLRWCEMLSRSL